MIFGNISMIYHGIVWDIHEYPIKKTKPSEFYPFTPYFSNNTVFYFFKHWLVAGRESAWFGPWLGNVKNDLDLTGCTSVSTADIPLPDRAKTTDIVWCSIDAWKKKMSDLNDLNSKQNATFILAYPKTKEDT